MTAGSDNKKAAVERLPKQDAVEQSAIDQVFSDLGRREITPESAVDQLMALFQKGIGRAARQLAETHKANGLDFGRRLRRTVDLFLQEHGDAAEAGPVANRPPDERASRRSRHILEREFLILQALVGLNHNKPLAELVQLVKERDPRVTDAALIAHLDRLVKDGVIERKRKGLYAESSGTADHLKALGVEMDARGIEHPPAKRN